MSKPLPLDVLVAHGADPDDLLAAVGAHLWEPGAVERYKRSQIWSHPTAIMSYYLGLGDRYQVARFCLAFPIFAAVLAATFLGVLFLALEARVVAAYVAFMVASAATLGVLVLCLMTYSRFLCPLYAWRWETHRISLGGDGVGYHTKSSLQGVFDRTSGVPNFAKDLMRRVQTLFPDATFTIQIFGPDPILTVHLPNGTSRTILVWDGDNIIEPR